jgi:release factor glutamine methyltransferase
MTTLAGAVTASARALREAGVASPEVDARWLVEAAAGVDPRRAPGEVLVDGAAETLAGLVARRCAREPLQLVVGTTAFRTIELRCRPGVFVPRPETEVLAGIALELVRAAQQDGAGPVIVHEPCCGTGAIGLAVASEVDGAVVLLADRSESAVALATENRDALAARGELRSAVEVHRGELLDAFAASGHGSAHVIVANPPYLPAIDLAGLDPEVVDHDPHDALAGGPDGHEVVDELLVQASRALRPGGAVVLEVDARRSEEAVAVARRLGLVDARACEDLTGASRFVLARRPG